MFAAVELGQKISKHAFTQLEPELRYRLLQAQQAIQSANIPVIILLAGVEGSDRSGVVKRLNKWLDPRYLRTHAFWDETDEEKQRPLFWRYWRCMPQRGQCAIMFGSWYTPPIIDRVFNRLDDNGLAVALQAINNHERMLCDDNHVIIKLWFHIGRDTQQQRLQKKTRFAKSPTARLFREYAEHYQHFIRISEQAIRTTDTPQAPWHIIEATNKRYRDATAAEVIIQHLENHLRSQDQPAPPGPPPLLVPGGKTLLDNIDLRQTMDDKHYASRLASCQKQLARLVWQAHEQQRTIICLFEGWDASGKGGAIRRLTSAIDARLYQLISVAAPSDEELAHHYLWRFWRHIPRDGYMTVYDRSWYGRVLVERVEGLASEAEWRRAYHEINNFEQQLIDHRVILFKYWLHIDKQEQLKRFEERQQIPWKQHKITEEDWRNREKWAQYESAIQDMISKTSTAASPWTLVPANDKKFGRIQVLHSLCRGLQQALS